MAVCEECRQAFESKPDANSEKSELDTCKDKPQRQELNKNLCPDCNEPWVKAYDESPDDVELARRIAIMEILDHPDKLRASAMANGVVSGHLVFPLSST